MPHSSSCYNATAEQIIKKVSELSNNISTQTQIIPENGSQFSDLELDALANIITYELIYYHQLGEIGQFCASKFDDLYYRQQVLSSISNQEEADVLSVEPTQTAPTSPNANPLSSSMLAASESIHKKIGDLCMKMGIASEQYLLGPAGYITSNAMFQQRHYIGLLTHSILVCLGGCSFKGGQMTSSISINEILAEIATIAETAWSMINLCPETETFRSAAKGANNIMICPNESIFGNYRQAPKEEIHTLFLRTIHKSTSKIPV
jgi:hypothetical protein